LLTNKFLLISSPFGLGLLILNVAVFISVFGAFTEQSFLPQQLAPITPVAQKSEPKTNEEKPMTKDASSAGDVAVFGMSVSDYAETQVRFLERMDAPSWKVDPWESPYEPSEPPERDEIASPGRTPNPTPSPVPRPSLRPSQSPQPTSQPNNGTLFNAGGPTSGPVPIMPNGACPRAFPNMLIGGCYSA
jgi:hypothetical protein